MNWFGKIIQIGSNALSALMVFVLLSATIQPEIDLCSKKPVELTERYFSDKTVNANIDVSNERTNPKESDSPSTRQTHWSCHLGHACHLIFWPPIAMAFRERKNLKTDIFLFPPKELFLDGPFKPPKSLS